MSFNILVVDDSNSMRAVIKKVISLSGFKVDCCFEAGNGREALAVLANDWVDVIISDINMPEVNGLELLNKLRQDILYKEIPVVIVTTEGSNERMEEVFNLGAKGFIKKPFLPEELRRVLYQVIGVGNDGEYGEDRKDLDGFDF
ncbi:MAG: response regulator [Deltaproteobacteria bacterium]|jgi:two-component system chemotaxis response regulator CheY|nr:MAG: response regulator [Deltaproteobacteria bacterium]